jgi:hypothetical protein
MRDTPRSAIFACQPRLLKPTLQSSTLAACSNCSRDQCDISGNLKDPGLTGPQNSLQGASSCAPPP